MSEEINTTEEVVNEEVTNSETPSEETTTEENQENAPKSEKTEESTENQAEISENQDESVDAPENMVDHTLTDEDIKNNPELAEEGLKAGDEVGIIPPTEEIDETTGEDAEVKTLSTDEVLDRAGYRLYFVHRDNKTLLNELRNSGKTSGEINITTITDNDHTDEIIIAVKE